MCIHRVSLVRPAVSKNKGRLRMAKLIFLGGVHGVGKTTLCKLIKDSTGTPHYTASKLISNQIKSTFTTKKIKNIDSNQDALISAINSFSFDSKYYILDGHYCLLNSESKIIKIPASTFRSLEPAAIILMKATSEDIVKRLSERDCQEYPLRLIESFQEKEEAYYEELKRDLGVPNFLVTGETPSIEVVNYIKKIWNEG